MTEKEKAKVAYLMASCGSCKSYSFFDLYCTKYKKPVKGWEAACPKYKPYKPFRGKKSRG